MPSKKLAQLFLVENSSGTIIMHAIPDMKEPKTEHSLRINSFKNYFLLNLFIKRNHSFDFI